MIRELARSSRNRQEVDAWSLLNNGFTSGTGFDGDVLFSTTHTGLDGVDRANRPAVDIGLSITGLQAAVNRFETMTNDRNLPQLLSPSVLVIHPNNKFVAREILGSTAKPFTADNELNALVQEDISWMISHYLTSQTAWFLLAGKGSHDLNFLWRDRPIFDSFDDPWTKNAVFSVYQRHTKGYGSWRGSDGSTG